MTINKNSVEQINVALLDMDKKIKSAISNGTSASDFKNLEASVDSIKRTLDEAKTGLEPGKTYNINISGNAATATKATTATIAEKANKLVNDLIVNGKTYNGSEAVDAGVQTVANGGTGVTTQAEINKAFVGDLELGESDVTDGTEFVSSWASDNGFAETAEGANKPYKRKFIKVWNYIKGKISSVLGLTATNYGGTAATILDYNRNTPIKVRWGGPGIDSAEWYPAFSADGSALEPINRTNIHAGNADSATTADYAGRLAAFASWNNPYEWDSTNGVRVYVYKIAMASWFNSILVQIYDDINYARCRRYVLGLWHVDGFGYSVSVTDLGGTKDGGLHVWFGNDGNVYLQADVYWTSRIAFSRLDDITDVTITKIGEARYGSNTDINGNVLFTPLADPIVDCGALRADDGLSSVQKIPQILKTDVLRASSRLTIPIGAPSSPQDGDIWIER